jgi:hypothetical protein
MVKYPLRYTILSLIKSMEIPSGRIQIFSFYPQLVDSDSDSLFPQIKNTNFHKYTKYNAFSDTIVENISTKTVGL